MKTHGKDILLLCKRWYNQDKHETLEDALVAYYHKNYGCEDITPDYGFINRVLLKPAIEEFGEIYYNKLLYYLFNDDILIRSKKSDGTYDNDLYNRLITFLTSIKVKGYIDVSDYFHEDDDGRVKLRENII